MKLCCVCGMKLTRKQVRYVTELDFAEPGKVTQRTRIVCPTHEKEINAGQVPVLSE